MAEQKDIYYQGKIYVGCERQFPTRFNTADEQEYQNHLSAFANYFTELTSYPVTGTHSFKDGQDVTGLYELGNDKIEGTNKYHVVAIPTTPPDKLDKEAATLYTYYQLDLENMPVEWDYTICETLEDVLQQLKALDIHLDDDTPTHNGKPRSVTITGIPMTPSAYKEFIEEADLG